MAKKNGEPGAKDLAKRAAELGLVIAAERRQDVLEGARRLDEARRIVRALLSEDASAGHSR